MSKILYSNRSSENHELIRLSRIVLVTSFFFCLFIIQPVKASNGNDIPHVESIYIIDQSQSNLFISYDNVSESYSIQGQFNFYIGGFTDSNAMFINAASYPPSGDLADLYNFFGLAAFSISNNVVYLIGTTTDGYNGDITLSMTFNGDLVYLEGQITPTTPDGYYSQFSAVAVRKYGGGTGTPDNPYLISTAKHMNTIGLNPEDWSSSFKLTEDISLSTYKNKDFNIIGYYKNETDNKSFSGNFNGNGKTIQDFTYIVSGIDRIGLFGYINGKNASITNLGIIDPNINAIGGDYIGAFVGQLANGNVTSCYVTGGSISGKNKVGGLIGRNGSIEPVTNINEDHPCTAGTVQNCASAAVITGTTEIGGLVGSNDGIISDCNTTANVTGGNEIGGFAGFNGGVILDCHSSASVSGSRGIGSFVGNNYGIICGGDAGGTVLGQESVGGIAGYNNGGYIKYCSSSGIVDGNSIVGGLAGTNGGNIYGSFSSGNVTGDLYVGGCVGKNFWQISNCFSIADVNVQNGYSGGLSGTNESNGLILNCYSSGSVSGRIYIGGLLGRNDGVIMKCYSTGMVTDNYSLDGVSIGFGGLIGDSNEMSTAFLSYWDTQTSGRANSAGGIGKTTTQMKEIASFNDWGKCSDVVNWTIYQDQNDSKNNDYPRLLWEGADGNPIEPVQLSELLAGSGSEDDPYLIFTAQELSEIGLFPCEWDKHFLLSADIDMSQNASDQFNIIGFYRLPFTGVFDGNGHAISEPFV